MIDLPSTQLAEVQKILLEFVPDYEVWAFGSRVNGTAKKTSDLDLVLRGKSPLPIAQKVNLKEAFAESTLPIKIDFVEWNDINETFKTNITVSHEIIH